MSELSIKPLEDLIDDALEGRLAAREIIAAVDGRKEPELAAVASTAYLVARAIVPQLLRLSRLSEAAREWRDALLWLRGRFEAASDRNLSVRLETLSDLLDDRLRLMAQHPIEELLRRDHVQQMLLFLLDHHGRASRSKVQKALGLKEANLTRVLSLIEAHGLIEREVKGRARNIALTQQGREALRGQRRASRPSVVAEPVWCKGLPAPPAPARLEVDAASDLASAQLLFAKELGLDRDNDVEIVVRDGNEHQWQRVGRPIHEARICAGEAFAPTKAQESLAVFVTNRLPNAYVLSIPGEKSRKTIDREFSSTLAAIMETWNDTQFITNDKWCLSAFNEATSEARSPVKAEYVEPNRTLGIVAASLRKTQDARFVFLCPSDGPRSNLALLVGAMASGFDRRRGELANPELRRGRRSALAAIHAIMYVNVKPSDWLEDLNNSQAVVSGAYRLASSLSEQMPKRVDEFAQFLGTEVTPAAQLQDINATELGAFVRAGFEWWSPDVASRNGSLARDAIAEVLEEPKSSTSVQPMIVRAFEETQQGEVWRLHRELLERTSVIGIRQEFEAWFNSRLRVHAERGAWSYPMNALRQVRLRLTDELI